MILTLLFIQSITVIKGLSHEHLPLSLRNFSIWTDSIPVMSEQERVTYHGGIHGRQAGTISPSLSLPPPSSLLFDWGRINAGNKGRHKPPPRPARRKAD